MKNYSFAESLDIFLNKYLIQQKNTSSNTIRSYKTAFKLFIKYLIEFKKISIKNLNFENITRNNVVDFLNYLECDLNLSIQTRNQRLAAIKSFCNYILIEDISNLSNIQSILNIRKKKTDSKIIDYLTIEELNIFLNLIPTDSKIGVRDYTLISLMYDSAARANEIINLKVSNLKLDDNPSVTLYGKGNKYRIVPITNNTKKLLVDYIKLNKLGYYSYLFKGYNDKATTKMITHIINKYSKKCEVNKNIHPHCLRHSRAIHLLEAGITLIDIRDILGHSSVTTTEIYAKTSVELKRKAIESVYEINNPKEASWKKDKSLLNELLDLQL